MSRILKYTIALMAPFCLLAACSQHEIPQSPAKPGSASESLIVWDVAEVNAPGTESRSLVGPAVDENGDPYPDADWITLEEACTPTDAGGGGKAIGIWADYSYTDTDGMETTIKNVFEGTQLIYAHKENGNPHSDWNYTGSDLYWFIGGRYKFRAYFPQELESQVVASTNASTFVIEYPTHEFQEDLLVAYNRVDTNNPQVDLNDPVTLKFKHGLAALRFFIKANYTNTDYVTSCYLQNADSRDFATSGMLAYGSTNNEEQMTWITGYNPPVTEKIYYWSNSGVRFSTEQDASQASPAMAYTAAGTTSGDIFTQNDGWILILPQKSSGKLQFCFTTRSGNNAVYAVTIPQVTEQSQTADGQMVQSTEYQPGKRYTYTISITESNVELTLTVADWNERESSYDIVF